MATVYDIVTTAIHRAFNLPQDRIQRDVMQYAVSAYNLRGSQIWQRFPWDQTKLERITVNPTSDDHIEQFAPHVDAIRGAVLVTASGQHPIRAYEELMEGTTSPLTMPYYQLLPDSSSGDRRVRIVNALGKQVQFHCLRKFVRAEINPNYNPNDPQATPNDFRVLTWPIDRLEMDLIELIADDLRLWRGLPPRSNENEILSRAVIRENVDQARSVRVTPLYPSYYEAGNWW